MASMDLLTLHARERLQMPETWEPYLWKCLPHGQRQVDVYHVKGAVASLHTRGPRKGSPHWRKITPGTDCETYIPVAEHAHWVDVWAQTTGKCAECIGEGKTLARWSQTTGATYQPCASCQGTGQSLIRQEER